MEHISGIFEIFAWYECIGVKRFNTGSFQNKEGRHATPSEISLTMHERPHAFESKAKEVQKVKKHETYWPMTAREMKSVFPDGRMESAPWLADAETGGEIIKAAVNDLCKKIKPYLEMELH